MQESFSTLCFLGGFYLYLYPRKFSYKTFLSAAAFAGAFFTNYRLITLPAHVAFCEILLCMTEKRLPDVRKYMWHTIAFFFFVFMIGNLFDGSNTVIIFAWMFYQSNLAKGKLNPINFLSFPYYILRLESVLFGIMFFSNIYYVFKKKWGKIMPFGLVCLHMFIYSFASEKGARYLCVVLPFLVMSVASLFVHMFESAKTKSFRVSVVVLFTFVVGSLSIKAFTLVKSRSDYQPAIEYLLVK